MAQRVIRLLPRAPTLPGGQCLLLLVLPFTVDQSFYLKENQFKCLIFSADPHSPRNADIRTRLLSKLGQGKDIMVKAQTTACRRLVNPKHDRAMIGQAAKPSIAGTIQAVKGATAESTKWLPTACWSCARTFPVTSARVHDATTNDPSFQRVIRPHSTRWLLACPDFQLQPVFQRRSSFSKVDGCIPFAERVVIHSELQQ
ncbi:uncharacterized protein DEA37_0005897 [Paragonimus westermani]|uniref:Uncharacterized protein n=1 Tax=Paragonimus westermani TaxID=34504 RepID=A0A5J4NJ16_9TREM|nr:uncharacterized protein DEA37_0005897 [Paragonimus westermani]